jgi:hypothetical protein
MQSFNEIPFKMYELNIQTFYKIFLSDLFKMDYILHVNTNSNATLPLLEATNQHTLIL